jgi:hypothetical protein
MVCNPDRNGFWGYLWNGGLGVYAWHICMYGGAGRYGYYDQYRYAAWISTCDGCPGYYWYTNRWFWCPTNHCVI